MVRHVVIWSMASGQEGQLDSVLEELAALPARIGEIAALSAGRLINESVMEAVLSVDVADRASLERYRTHPAHQGVLERLRGGAAELVVADYEL